MKYLLGFLIIAVLVGGLAAGGMWYVKNKNTAAAGATTTQTAEVTRRTIEKIVTANGKVASNRDVEIKCQASGKVILLPFDISDRVKPGDLLMELDPVDQQRARDQAAAQVEVSKTRLLQAELNEKVARMNIITTTQRVEAELGSATARRDDAVNKARRTQELYNEKLASREEMETAQTAATQAEAQLKLSEVSKGELEQQTASLELKLQDISNAKLAVSQDQIKLDLAERQLQYTKVLVPVEENKEQPDFRVSSLTVQMGSVVQSGSSGFSGGTTVMMLSDVSHLFVMASVDESDIGQIADPAEGGEAQKVRVSVDAYPGERFEGHVVRVARKGVNTSNVVTFEVKIEVTSANRLVLRPEMTATANIVSESRVDALAIPTSAFLRQSAADRAAAQEAPADTGTTPVAAAQQGGEGRGGRGGGRGRGRGAGGEGGGDAVAALRKAQVVPQKGTVEVMKADNAKETRNVTVGLTDNEYYEVLDGLTEGESVVKNQVGGGDSRWRNQQSGNQALLRGMRGGGGGGGGGGGRGR